MGRHAPGIQGPALESMTPEETRYVLKRVNEELKAETELRIALAKAGMRH